MSMLACVYRSFAFLGFCLFFAVAAKYMVCYHTKGWKRLFIEVEPLKVHSRPDPFLFSLGGGGVPSFLPAIRLDVKQRRRKQDRFFSTTKNTPERPSRRCLPLGGPKGWCFKRLSCPAEMHRVVERRWESKGTTFSLHSQYFLILLLAPFPAHIHLLAGEPSRHRSAVSHITSCTVACLRTGLT